MDEKKFQQGLSREFNHCIDENCMYAGIIESIGESISGFRVYHIRLDCNTWIETSSVEKDFVFWRELSETNIFISKKLWLEKLLKIGARVMVQYLGINERFKIVGIGRIGKVEQSWKNKNGKFYHIYSLDGRRRFISDTDGRKTIKPETYVEVFSCKCGKKLLVRPCPEGKLFSLLQPCQEDISSESFDLLFPEQLDISGEHVYCGKEIYIPGLREIGTLNYGQMKTQCDVAAFAYQQFHIVFKYTGLSVEDGHRYVYYYNGRLEITNSRLQLEIQVVAELANE